MDKQSETVYLRRRQGFVRLAMQHGAPLVRVWQVYFYIFGKAQLSTAASQMKEDKGNRRHCQQSMVIVFFSPLRSSSQDLIEISFSMVTHALPFVRLLNVAAGGSACGSLGQALGLQFLGWFNG